VKKAKSLPGFFVTEKPIGVAGKKFSGVGHVGLTEATVKNRFSIRCIKGKDENGKPRNIYVITS